MTDTPNRITERGYTGTLVFYKNMKYDIYCIDRCSVEEFIESSGSKEGGDIFLGSCEVDVKFEVDTREAEIASLEKQRESIRAELGQKIANIEDRISKLRALPNADHQ